MKQILKWVLFAQVLMFVAGVNYAWAIDIQYWPQDNGARVYFVESHHNPLVDIQVAFDAGNRRDWPNKLGVSDMVAKLLDAGSVRYNEEQIREKIADLAVSVGAYSGVESAGVTIRSLSRSDTLNPTIELVGEMLSQPTFPLGVLEREKQRSIAGLKQSESKASFLVDRMMTRLMYGDHPYGYDARQTEQSLRDITISDVKAFWQRHYQPKFAVITIVGDLSRSQAEKVAEQLLGGLNNSSEAMPSVPSVEKMIPRKKIIAHPGVQAHIIVGMPLITRDDPDYYALIVGNHILGGGGFDSRLMKEIREKRGFTYGVYSYMSPMKVAGAFEISMATRKEQSQPALNVLQNVLSNFIEEGPTQAELDQAKSNIIGGFPLRYDSNRKLLMYLSMIGWYQLPLDFLDTYPKKVEQLTTEVIKETWQRRVKLDNFSVVVVGGE